MSAAQRGAASCDAMMMSSAVSAVPDGGVTAQAAGTVGHSVAHAASHGPQAGAPHWQSAGCQCTGGCHREIVACIVRLATNGSAPVKPGQEDVKIGVRLPLPGLFKHVWGHVAFACAIWKVAVPTTMAPW
jgi:hypothetical protein